MVYSGGKCFECNECGKTLTLKSNLKKHKKVHENENPEAYMPINATIVKKAVELNIPYIHMRQPTIVPLLNCRTPEYVQWNPATTPIVVRGQNWHCSEIGTVVGF